MQSSATTGTASQGPDPLPGPSDRFPGASAPETGRTPYRTSRARTTAFSFIFLLLLPFFASLPVMIVQRAASGRWDATIGLAILAVGFAAVMFLVLVELLFSIRARVELGETSVRLTLPRGRGLVPMLRYLDEDVPYAAIKAVELRREVYGGTLAPVLLQGARLMLKDGRALQLGYVNGANVDPAFPYADIAHGIASRAGLQVIDRGAVRRSVANKVMGIRTLDDGSSTYEEESVAALNRSHGRVVAVLVAGLVVLVGIGIAGDLMTPADPVTVQPGTAASGAKKK